MSLTPIALELDQGDDEVIAVTVHKPRNADGSDAGVADLSGCTLTFRVRTSATQPALITLTSADDITISDQSGADKGKAEIAISAAVSDELDAKYTNRSLRWELDVLDTNQLTTTLARGTVVFNPNVAGG